MTTVWQVLATISNSYSSLEKLNQGLEESTRGGFRTFAHTTFFPISVWMPVMDWVPSFRAEVPLDDAQVFQNYQKLREFFCPKSLQVAKQMVMTLGMSPEIGQRLLGGQQGGGPFMGRDFMGQGAPPISQALKQKVDDEVKRIVDEQYQRGMKLLRVALKVNSVVCFF